MDDDSGTRPSSIASGPSLSAGWGTNTAPRRGRALQYSLVLSTPITKKAVDRASPWAAVLVTALGQYGKQFEDIVQIFFDPGLVVT